MLFQKLLQPVSHFLQVPGKQLQARVSHAYNYWLKVPADKLVVVNDIANNYRVSLFL